MEQQETDAIVLDDSTEKDNAVGECTPMETNQHDLDDITDGNRAGNTEASNVNQTDTNTADNTSTIKSVTLETDRTTPGTNTANSDIDNAEQNINKAVSSEQSSTVSLSNPQSQPMETVRGNSEEAEQAAGACEELCIIPDTDRFITQAEKDAAALVPPVRDAIEAMESSSTEISAEKSTDTSPEIYVLVNSSEDVINSCEQCCLSRKAKYKLTHATKTLFVCDDSCLAMYKDVMGNKISILEESVQEKVTDAAVPQGPFSRKCMDCKKKVEDGDFTILSWETLEFCNDLCLAKYQKHIGSECAKCKTAVQENCMGKYCVRFGYNIRQFCSSPCLELYKKGLKVCSYCQKEMGEEGFLAPVTDKSLFKDFCTKECLDKYKALSKATDNPQIEGTCSVCNKDKPAILFEHRNKQNQFCGEPCLVAFKYVNNISAGKCDMCHKYFDNVATSEFTMYYDDALRTFCSKGCQNVYIIANRKIVPCSWCKVKKYNFDMIKHQNDVGASFLTCSLNCLNQQVLSFNKGSSTWTTCDQCRKSKQALYHLTMSDTSTRSFCSYSCVLEFQHKFSKTKLNEPVPVSGPKRFIPLTAKAADPDAPTMPIITSVQSLANVNGSPSQFNKRSKHNGVVSHVTSPPQTIVKTQVRQQVIIRPPFPVAQRNVSTMCKVTMVSKGIGCNTITTAEKAVQTDEIKPKLLIIPVPVPIYVPLPMKMYSQPYPVPFPFPLPIPTPVFIPTTRNTSKGIMKEIKKIQAKMPANPLEAEILMMADMVAGDKNDDLTESETEGEEHTETAADDRVYTPEPETTTAFGEEVLEMAIKMAAELDEPAVDLERALAVNTVTVSVKSESATQMDVSEVVHPERRTRSSRGGRSSRGRRQSRRSVSQPDISILGMEEPETPQEPQEKPDANLCLKYTFGVNAWKQWVATKNAELEQTSNRTKLFKSEILQLTADELNYSLCLFVKEVRKPNGQEYAPDTIYYLCLGIQQYLYENSRIDNIFCDTYYEKFTDCLDEVAKKFSVLYNDSHYIITRVEEEHLWESKQLGAHSPHVLLSTLMFFNTKHFNLISVEDHMQLSFSHIMKHWKRNPSQSGNQKFAGSRNVLLRFYPPQSTTEGNRKKKVYEQQENEENPLRCPVKLYEFYLSKCPESVKTRNDVFYLLPERSCVPDSPVWYSTSALPKDALEKMLHRVKMVKEINVALLTT